MTNLQFYLKNIDTKHLAVSDMVDKLTHKERIALRTSLKTTSCKDKLMRNLFYDYDKQTWID